MTPFERWCRDEQAKYRRDKGLPPLKDDITIPESIRKPRMIKFDPHVVINGKAEPWNPDRDYSK